MEIISFRDQLHLWSHLARPAPHGEAREGLFYKELRAAHPQRVQPARASRVSLQVFTADFHLPSEPVTVCES